ncbi:hypothetical protein ACFLU4_02540 [Chloroflexota bacterium]
MEKTAKPTIAGILNIVAGAFNILGFLGVIIGILVLVPFSSSCGPGPAPEFGRLLVASNVGVILWIGALFLLVTGILPIIGGIYALKRKRWGLALAGSIAAIVGSAALGITATVFTALGKDEFE